MRMWEIREKDKYSDYRMGNRHMSAEEAYECGYEDGYKEAMEEIEEMGSRTSSYRMGERSRDSRGRYR